jgi:hypothetical protein
MHGQSEACGSLKKTVFLTNPCNPTLYSYTSADDLGALGKHRELLITASYRLSLGYSKNIRRFALSANSSLIISINKLHAFISYTEVKKFPWLKL